MPKMLKHYLLFLFPFIVSSVVLFDRDSFYFAPNNDDMYVEIKPSGVFYLCYAYFSLFFAYAVFYVSSLINKKSCTVALAATMYATSFIYTAHFFITGQFIHQNSVFVLFDTNVLEAADFLRALTFAAIAKTVLLTAVYIAFPVVLLRHTFPLPAFQKKKTAFSVFAFSVLAAAGLEKICVHSNLEPFTRALCAVAEYRTDVNRIKRMKETLYSGKIPEITSAVPEETPETYVIVIGESASRLYHPFYTQEAIAPSPLKDLNLKIFNNVSAAATITEASLEAVFFKPFPSGESGTFLSFPDFLKGAGFKTFWLSNQFRIGKSDNVSGLLSERADETVFTNTTDSYQKNFSHVPLDEKLIPHFENALNDPARKKVVFVHLFGSHLPYFRRFPADLKIEGEDESFAGTVRRTAASNNAFKERMAYTKSLYYTDTLLKRMIRTLSQKGSYASLIYFSDHGADPENGLNRTDDSALLAVPFFVWTAPEYDAFNATKVKQMSAAAGKKYNTKRLFSTLADWMNLTQPALTAKRDSLFSQEYKEETPPDEQK